MAVSHHYEPNLGDDASDQLPRPGTSDRQGHRTARHRLAGIVRDAHLADEHEGVVHALNRRPFAPQACPEAAQASSTLPNAAEPFRSAPLPAVQGSQRFVTIHRDFATNLLPAIEQLLTVRQVAQFLGVCTATVYKWAAEGVLPHVRIVNVIRIRPEDLTRFVNERSR
ncbi:MAG: helix-turn-helix domain-containing protein [Deltaproteobacteria bacterium]|nr:MAG: helix-turn-helix domain-containing protein [Deltaproteobacteria bacterium]